MVTHNPELAKSYATRIVSIKDGKILSDTNPYIIENEKYTEPVHKNLGKTTMSFFTSLSLSFNNLKTKKGRTILTSFAGSIGIIGIALILSLSNGVNRYIKSVEEDTLSEYPLQIQSSGVDISSLLMGSSNDDGDNKESGDINVSKRLTSMFSTIGSNDLVSLKQYLESDDCNIEEYAKAIEYSYDVTPRIYHSDIENLRQVNPDITFSSLGMGSGASKHNVSQVFNAETIIIGSLAGIIGVGITLLLLIPTNQIIASIANGVNVRASLPFTAGIILIVLSIVLTLIGGILPSRKAAKEDPVLALRSE